MLVATAVVITFATTAISQEWWMSLRDYIEQRTSATPPKKVQHGSISAQDAGKWLLALGGVWVVLTLLVDLGDTAELASALAIVWAGSVMMVNGPQALANLGFLQQSEVPSGSS